MGWKGILGFEYGIVQAPMGNDLDGPQLVAAVANAGGLGILKAPNWNTPDYMRELIWTTKALTEKPFGVGLILFSQYEENLKVILEEKVGFVQVSWGDVPSELVTQAHSAGVKVVPMVGSVEAAKQAIDAGVDAIVVQGIEAGGHILEKEGLIPLIPRVLDLVGDRDIPVIAAGGIVDGRGYAAVLALGAQGVCLGTRFLATKESFAHPSYKRALTEYSETAYTDMFGRARWLPNTHHRVLPTPFFKFWDPLPSHVTEETNQPIIGHARFHDRETNIRRFEGTAPNETTTTEGEFTIEDMALYAGQGVGLIKEILTAAEVIETLVKETQEIIRSINS